MPELFPELPKIIQIGDQIASVEREIGMRRQVYPRWVERGKMTKAKADYELACMEAVLATLKGLTQS